MIPETVPASSLTTLTGHHDTSAEPWIVSSRDYHNHLAIAAALGQLQELRSSLTYEDSA
jgi:hypothetical protein